MSATALAGRGTRDHRREVLRDDATRTGLDYVEVEWVNRERASLLLGFIPPRPGVAKSKVVTDAIAAITPDQIEIATITPGAGRLTVDSVASAETDYPDLRRVVVSHSGPAGAYTLGLVGLGDALDPFFARATFSLAVDEPGEFDCVRTARAEAPPPPTPEIDYLARDYASFRKLMMDRLALLVPGWGERNPVDWTTATVEALAAAADQLGYYQDAVATEAYLGTARRRVSVRRHARLLDYPMHEGCTARTWVVFEAGPADAAAGAAPLRLPARTPLLTRIGGQRARIHPGSSALREALAADAEVFETLHDIDIRPEHDEIPLASWQAFEFWLPKGATAAALKKPAAGGRLRPGDVLVLEEKRSPTTGEVADRDPEKRHAVRLARVTESPAEVGGGGIVEVEWHREDALPFSLCVAAGGFDDVTVARANVVLVESGRSVPDHDPRTAPETGTVALEPVVTPERGYARLLRAGVCHGVPYDDAVLRSRSATASLVQDPRACLPAVVLVADSGETWEPRRDLLASDRFAREFVVEVESDRSARLRFGDGVRGRRPVPGMRFGARYRVGNGAAGNVGRDAIAHLVIDDADFERVRVSQPLPARGGTDAEPIERVRLDAPSALYASERCVSEADYVAAARRHPEVVSAAAQRDSFGGWPVVVVAVERHAGLPVDTAFAAEVRAFLEPLRLAGAEVQVRAPRYVPLDICLHVQSRAGHFASSVRQALLETFSDAELPDGRRGFFHRANLGFGQPVHLSRVLAAAMDVPGVAWVELASGQIRFQRHGRAARGEVEAGRIEVGPLEIARVDNDDRLPGNGSIVFEVRDADGRP